MLYGSFSFPYNPFFIRGNCRPLYLYVYRHPFITLTNITHLCVPPLCESASFLSSFLYGSFSFPYNPSFIRGNCPPFPYLFLHLFITCTYIPQRCVPPLCDSLQVPFYPSYMVRLVFHISLPIFPSSFHNIYIHSPALRSPSLGLPASFPSSFLCGSFSFLYIPSSTHANCSPFLTFTDIFSLHIPQRCVPPHCASLQVPFYPFYVVRLVFRIFFPLIMQIVPHFLIFTVIFSLHSHSFPSVAFLLFATLFMLRVSLFDSL